MTLHLFLVRNKENIDSMSHFACIVPINHYNLPTGVVRGPAKFELSECDSLGDKEKVISHQVCISFLLCVTHLFMDIHV